MAQTAALMYAEGDVIDYTPVAAVAAGAVVLLGTIPMIAPVAIAAGVKGALQCAGIVKVPQKAEVITAGDAVYWDADGTPVTGDTLSGAATGTASAGELMGACVETTAATDTYVKVLMSQAKRTATIAGAVTATSVVGSDSDLQISGIPGSASAGGAVTAAGGAGAGAGNGKSVV